MTINKFVCIPIWTVLHELTVDEIPKISLIILLKGRFALVRERVINTDICINSS